MSSIKDSFYNIDSLFEVNSFKHSERVRKIKNLSNIDDICQNAKDRNKFFNELIKDILLQLSRYEMPIVDILNLNISISKDSIASIIPEPLDNFNESIRNYDITNMILDKCVEAVINGMSLTKTILNQSHRDSFFKKCSKKLMGSENIEPFDGEELAYLTSVMFAKHISISSDNLISDEIKDLLGGWKAENKEVFGLITNLIFSEIKYKLYNENISAKKRYNDTLLIIDSLYDLLTSENFKISLFQIFEENSLNNLIEHSLTEAFHEEFVEYTEVELYNSNEINEIRDLLDVLYFNREKILNEIKNHNLHSFGIFSVHIINDAIFRYIERKSYYDSMINTKNQTLQDKVDHLDDVCEKEIKNPLILCLKDFCNKRIEFGATLEHQWSENKQDSYNFIKQKIGDYINSKIEQSSEETLIIMYLNQIKHLNDEMSESILKDLYITFEDALSSAVGKEIVNIQASFFYKMQEILHKYNDQNIRHKIDLLNNDLVNICDIKIELSNIILFSTNSINKYKLSKNIPFIKIDNNFNNFINNELLKDYIEFFENSFGEKVASDIVQISNKIDFSELEFKTKNDKYVKFTNIALDVLKILKAKLSLGTSVMIESLHSSNNMITNDAFGAIETLKINLGDAFKEEEQIELYKKLIESGDTAGEFLEKFIENRKMDDAFSKKVIINKLKHLFNKRWNFNNHDEVIINELSNQLNIITKKALHEFKEDVDSKLKELINQ